MIRTETYLGGRLVKEIDLIDVLALEGNASTDHAYVDGRHRWLLDGAEVTDDEALDAWGTE